MAGNPSADDYYAVLGVAPGAGEADIKKAYKTAALRHHPGACFFFHESILVSLPSAIRTSHAHVCGGVGGCDWVCGM